MIIFQGPDDFDDLPDGVDYWNVIYRNGYIILPGGRIVPYPYDHYPEPTKRPKPGINMVLNVPNIFRGPVSEYI